MSSPSRPSKQLAIKSSSGDVIKLSFDILQPLGDVSKLDRQTDGVTFTSDLLPLGEPPSRTGLCFLFLLRLSLNLEEFLEVIEIVE